MGTFRSYLTSYIYSFLASDYIRKFRSFCSWQEPLYICASTFAITSFFYRVAAAYKYNHPKMHQRPTIGNTVVTIVCPLLVLLWFLFQSGNNGRTNAYLGFGGAVSLLSLAYHLLIGKLDLVLGSFFPICATVSSLLIISRGFIYVFVLAIPISMIVWKNEKDTIVKKLFSGYLIVSCFGLLIGAHGTDPYCSCVGGWIGSVLALLSNTYQ